MMGLDAIFELFKEHCGDGLVALVLWYLCGQVKGIRKDFRDYRTKEECEVRHQGSCARLDKVEEDIKEILREGGKRR